LGNPDEFTIAELAEQVLALTGSKSEIRRLPLPSDDPVRRRPDIAFARKALDWEPRVPLSEGLPRTIEYFDELLRRHGRALRGGRGRRLRRPRPTPRPSCARTTRASRCSGSTGRPARTRSRRR